MRRFCRGLVLFIFFTSWLSSAAAQVVNMPDANLRAAVRKVLGLAPTGRITKQAMSRLTILDAARDEKEELDFPISDLTGLEHATQLEVLNLWQHRQISDISPLAGLTRLRELDIQDNIISDISPLAGLTQLRVLNLGSNQISDISPLAGLTQLRDLALYRNQISDISPLAGLKQLSWLYLAENQISDISPLAGLTQLRYLGFLGLSNNQISDLSPLASLTQLESLDLVNNQIRDVTPLVGLVRLKRLSLAGNPVEDVSPLATLTSLVEVDVEIPNQVRAGDVIADRHLAGAVRRVLGLTNTEPISKRKLQDLRSLNLAHNNQVSSLKGLEHATQLEALFLNRSQIKGDISVIANLTQLKRLTLGNSQIRDISALANLRQLMELNLQGNEISDLTPLLKLTKLEFLWLVYNRIADLSPLANLKRLTDLGLYSNAIRDVSPLSGLLDLQTLSLDENPIGDASALANLPNLRDVDIEIPAPSRKVVSIPDPNLRAVVRKALNLKANAPITQQAMQRLTKLEAKENQIKDLTGLEHAAQLRVLEVRKNQIRNIRPLAKLKSLQRLILDQNSVSDISPIANLMQLTWLLVGGNPISDFTPLANLNQLEGLALWGSNIGDVTLLANKTKLTHLWLGGNNIRNIAPFANLTQLKVLELRDNHIRNVNPLVGLKKLEELSLRGNPIQDLSPLRQLLKQNPNLDLDLHPNAGPKIEGPWVWMIAPTGGNLGSKAAGSGKDWLAAASGGSVTERHIATNGATPGAAVGNKVWTSGKLASTGNNNIAEMVKAIGLGNGNYYIEHHVAYGSLSLYSPRKQNTKMYVGSDDAVKVWLNGVLVHNNPADREAHDYQDTFSVTLKQGRNILLVAVYNGLRNWIAFFGFEKDAVYSLAPTAVVHIGASERPPLYWVDASTGALHRLIGDEVENLLPGVQNAISLAVVNHKMYWTENAEGNTGTVKRANLEGSNVRILTTSQSVPTSIAIDAANGKLYWTNSSGRIQTVNFNGGAITNLLQNLKNPSNITLDAARGKLYWGEPDSIWRADLNGHNREAFAPNLGELWSIAIAGSRIYSIERPEGERHYQLRSSTLDGLTPTQTLATLQSKPLGLAVDTAGEKLYWTSADGKIQRANLNGENIQNVVTGLHAPGDIVLGIPTPTTPAAPGNTALVTHPLPVETRLLANYPNPFNPETWIPYELATDTNVQILIYDGRGTIVRRLGLGHQPAGTYTDRSQAAYWDGRNTFGEPVASGLYFYQLQTDTVSLLQKMLIVK